MAPSDPAALPAQKSAYDRMPYRTRPVPETHPRHLAAVARLYGAAPRDPRAARVLEIGCGDGGNVVPMAAAAPGASFVGVDLMADRISAGQALADRLGLANLQLVSADVAMVPPADFGGFDYIVAHGVLSQVPPAVAVALMRLIGQILNPGGVAYVSFNARPGARLRQAAADVMHRHADRFTDPVERLRQARAILEVTAGTARSSDPAYPKLLAEVCGHVRGLDDAALAQDLMAAQNHAVSIRDFVALARASGLEYLGDADPTFCTLEPLPPALADLVPADAGRIAREQYLDYWIGRRFRAAVLVGRGTAVRERPDPAALAGLVVASDLKRRTAADGARIHVGRDGTEARIEDVEVDAALAVLARHWPRGVGFAELAGAAAAASSRPPEAALAVLQAGLYALFQARQVDLSVSQWPCASAAPARPRASLLARRQFEDGAVVTNLRHESVRIGDPVIGAVLRLADGRQDRLAMLRRLERRVAAGLLPLQGLAPDRAVELALQRLAELALLEAEP